MTAGPWYWRAHHPYARPVVVVITNEGIVTFPGETFTKTLAEAQAQGTFIARKP